mgnify:CR=1 FL=1
MAIEVFIERENRNKSVEAKGKMVIKDLLKELNVNPVTVIVVKNNELVTEDSLVNDKDKIKLMSVVSGG